MTKEIINNLKLKDSRTISRSISMVENKEDGHLDFLSDIYFLIQVMLIGLVLLDLQVLVKVP